MKECYKCSEVVEDLNCCAVPLAVVFMSSGLPLNGCFELATFPFCVTNQLPRQR